MLRGDGYEKPTRQLIELIDQPISASHLIHDDDATEFP